MISKAGLYNELKEYTYKVYMTKPPIKPIYNILFIKGIYFYI